MKTYRRFIRIDDKLEASPKFARKADAEEWYRGMLKKKHFDRQGIEFNPLDTGLTFIMYARTWMADREKSYPAATVKSDEQRLRDYILPILAEKPIARITSEDVHQFLKKISRTGFKHKDFGISPGTRDKVKVLLSTILSSAMNESPPLITRNPVFGVQIKEKRKGKATPVHLAKTEDCLSFLAAARELGEDPFTVVAIVLMSGLRKQELIALKWACVDFSAGEILVKEKYEQASNSILAGTKAGESSSRIVPIPAELVRILVAHRKVSNFSADADFVVCAANGRFIHARKISYMIEAVRTKAGLHCTTHGLRHTYGREFVLRSGNKKALQAILGHVSSSTTDIYSDLSHERTRGFGETVSFKTGVRKSPARHTVTPKRVKGKVSHESN